MDNILIVPGDGFGPSVVDIAVKTLEAVSTGIDLIPGEIGYAAYEKSAQDITLETLEALAESKGVLCGPCRARTDDRGKTHDPLDILKTHMCLFAMMRRFKSYRPGGPRVALDLWASFTAIGRDTVETAELGGITLTKYVRTSNYDRTMGLAYSIMKVHSRNKVACISSDDIFPESSRLFREEFDSIFGEGFETEHMNVAEWSEDAVMHPERFDAVICADLYSRMAAGVMAGITGGNHLSPYLYPGEKGSLLYTNRIDDFSKDRAAYANPTAAIASAAMLMQAIGRVPGADAVFRALEETYAEGSATPDMGGNLTTAEFADRFFRHLRTLPFIRAPHITGG